MKTMKKNNVNLLLRGLTLAILFVILLFKPIQIFGSNWDRETSSAFLYIQPDTLFADTIDLNLGDTVAIYSEGADSVYILYEDSIVGADSLYYDLEYPTNHILVSLSSDHRAVNEGVHGFNLSDMFEVDHGNVQDNDNYSVGGQPNPWDALIALSPKTLRVFSGAGSRFMHPLGFKGATGLTNGGYGFNLEEIVRYFDKTQVPFNDNPGIPAIIADILGGADPEKCENCGLWMDASVINAFEDFYGKYKKQEEDFPAYNALDYPTRESQPLYINQLLELVKQIEAANPGHTVDIIYCVNILSETATAVKETVEYMRSNSIHNVNVAGVEIGNEVYFNFYNQTLNFTDFFDYWDYIHGYNAPGMETLLSPEMFADHDYITELKGTPGFDVKLGLPAANLSNCGEEGDYPLITNEDIEFEAMLPGGGGGCVCGYPQWNLDMATTYGTVIGSKFQYDAIILHNYYTPSNSSVDCPVNTNWQDIMLQLHLGYNPATPEAAITGTFKYPAPSWSYASYGDSRLVPAFYGITGKHFPTPGSPLLPGNFKEFTRDRIDNAFEAHAPHMLFNAGYVGSEAKEIWMTEYNLKDDLDMPGPYGSDNNTKLQDFESSVVNTFSHAVMLQNWFLWNLKSAYDPTYRPNFLTRATLQNFLSGSGIALMTPSNKEDRAILGISTCGTFPDSPTGYDKDFTHYIRKINYYAPYYWKVISDKHLQYLQSTTTMYVNNDNIAPTVFIDVTAKKLYVIFSNVKYSSQVYGFDPEDLGDIYGPGYDVELEYGSIIGHILDAEQLYSTYGNSSIFDINNAYKPCPAEIGIYGRMSSFTNVVLSCNTICPSVMETIPGSVCVTVPAISMGYFEIPFNAYPRLGEPKKSISIFPNPTSNKVTVYILNQENEFANEYQYKVIDKLGTTILKGEFTSGGDIQLSSFPNGLYTIVVYENGKLVDSKEIVFAK